jgi:glycosyltransferase involved in cell wall biosynthesis
MLDNLVVSLGISIYQDFGSAHRLIPSVHKKVEHIIAVDGRYPGYGDDKLSGLSTDGTREYLQQFSNIHLIDMPNSPQVAKRSRYLEEAGKYKTDVLIVVDADEWIEEIEENGGWWDFRSKVVELFEEAERDGLGPVHNLYGIWERYGAPDQFQHNPRVILRPEECEYYFHHNFVRNKSKGYREWMEAPFSKGIILRGDNHLRTKEREQTMTDYEDLQSHCDERLT